MRFKVNENCISCGLCEAVCPEIFSLGEDIASAKQEDVTGELQKSALEAMHGCPVAAIEQVE